MAYTSTTEHVPDPLPPLSTSAAGSKLPDLVPLAGIREQATLHFSPAFWGLLLPITVNERVSDIWRSYFTQALLPATGAVTAVAAPWVTRVSTVNSFEQTNASLFL